MDNGVNVWWLEFPFWTSCWKTLLEDAYGDYGCLMTLVFFVVFGKFCGAYRESWNGNIVELGG
jgi:hypothetical protein